MRFDSKEQSATNTFNVPDRFIKVNSGELVRHVIMSVGHVAVETQVVVVTHGALPANTTQRALITHFTSDFEVTLT